MSLAPDRIDHAFESLLPFLQDQPGLLAEFQSSISTFFHGQPGGSDTRDTLLAARRHLEWFALENSSRELGGIPILTAGEAWLERVEPDSAHRDELLRGLRDSRSGVFEVTGVQPGEGAWLRDLAGFGEYPVAEALGADVLEVGDLIVGRLFPLGEGVFHISRAAGFYRNPELRKALIRDLSRAREQGGGKVLHIAQADLEAMFWRDENEAREGSHDSEVPEDELRELLRGASLSEQQVGAWFGRLAAIPFDPSRLVHGAGDVMGEMLDELAFETDIDLEQARRLLVRVWSRNARVLGPAGKNKQASPATATRKPVEQDGVDVRAAVEAFDRGRQAGGDLEQLFQALEEDLELEPTQEIDDQPSPDFPGVVGAMVEEFLWEVGQGPDPSLAQRFEVLRSLGQFGEGIGTFENLGADDLVRYSCFWLLEERLLSEPAEGEALVDALEAFCAWAEEAHEMPLRENFESALNGLRASLPRIVGANASLGLAARDSSDTGELLIVVENHGDRVRVRTGEGIEHEVRVAGRLLEWLQPDDPLRGRVQIDDSLSVFCCYPPEARRLAAQ